MASPVTEIMQGTIFELNYACLAQENASEAHIINHSAFFLSFYFHCLLGTNIGTQLVPHHLSHQHQSYTVACEISENWCAMTSVFTHQNVGKFLMMALK